MGTIDEAIEQVTECKAYNQAYTKDEVIIMLTELKTEIEKQCKIPNNNASSYDWNNGVYSCYKVVQQKIDKLKEVRKNDKRRS